MLFDLDNTLMDRDKTFENYCDRVIGRYMPDAAEARKREAKAFLIEKDEGGYGAREPLYEGFARGFCPSCAAEELYREWYSMPRECYVPMTGLSAFLDALARRVPMGVITNGSEITQTNKVDALGIRGYFQTILISGALAMAKPDARIFHLACERLGVLPGEAVFVGDHFVNDIEGAANAGLQPIWLARNPAEGGAFETVPSLAAVAEKLGFTI